MSSPDQAAKVAWDGATYQKVLLVALKVNTLDPVAIWESWFTLFGEESGPKPAKLAMIKQFSRLRKMLATGPLPNDSSMIKAKEKRYRKTTSKKGRKARQKAPSP